MNHFFDQSTLEMLNIRKTSPLANELTVLFESVMRRLDTANGNNQQLCLMANKLFHGIKKDLINTIFRHTGIRYKIHAYTGEPMGYFATSFNPTNEIRDNWGSTNDSRIKQHVDNVKEQIKKIHSGVDDFGKTAPEVLEYIVGKEVYLIFDVQTAFASQYYHEQAKRYSAQEIAAIVLHECGHLLSLCYTYSTVHTSLRNVTYTPKFVPTSDKEMKESMKVIKERLKKINDSSEPLATPISDNINKVLDSVEDMEENHKLKFKMYKIPIYIVIGIIMSIVTCYLYLIFALVSAFDGIYTALDDAHKWNKNSKGVKTSDFKLTSERIVDMEFRADDFVATHGLSGYLVSALDKLHDNSMIIFSGGPPSYPAQSMLMYAVNHAMMMLTSPLSTIRNSYGHDSMVRYKNIRRKLLQTLAQTKVPKESAKFIVEQIARVDVIMKKEQSSMKVYKFATNVAMFLSPFNLLSKLTSGDITRRYEKMYDTARDLEANEFNMLKYKIK